MPASLSAQRAMLPYQLFHYETRSFHCSDIQNTAPMSRIQPGTGRSSRNTHELFHDHHTVQQGAKCFICAGRISNGGWEDKKARQQAQKLNLLRDARRRLHDPAPLTGSQISHTHLLHCILKINCNYSNGNTFLCACCTRRRQPSFTKQ